MPIVPTVRCSNMKSSLAFYTGVLDFVRIGGQESLEDPSFSTLQREDGWLYLSSHGGDGEFGQAVAVIVSGIDTLFEHFLARGLRRPARESPVHHGPTDQSWGTREFYVDDPDGNTIRFVQLQAQAGSA